MIKRLKKGFFINMHSDSRSVNFSKNASFAMIAEMSSLLLSFLVRFFFVRSLAIEYLGIGGLFTSIINILSLAELGVGNAIVYSLYKPLAENDIEKIKSLIGYYKKVYNSIGCIIIVIGIALIPFLDLFIKERPNIAYSEFIVIYLLTILNTSVLYFLRYRVSIFSANQQGHIVKKNYIFFSTLSSITQIVILIYFHNYILYLIVSIVYSFLTNFVLSIRAKKQYPFLKEKAIKLDKDSSDQIKKNTFALLVYKVGNVIYSSLDTFLVSKFFGIIQVGIYSNYHFIISLSDRLFTSVLGTLTPSLGNLMATSEDSAKNNRVFSSLQLIFYWISTYLSVGMIVLFNPLIEMLFGKSYLFGTPIVIALVISITVNNFQSPCNLMRDASGLFKHGKFSRLIMSLLNLVFSIILINYWGIVGIIAGTIISSILTCVWYDPYIIHKYAIKDSLVKYFAKYIMHWILFGILAIVCNYLYVYIGIGGLLGFIIGALLVTVIVNLTMLLIFFKNPTFKYVISLIKEVLSKKKTTVSVQNKQ